ncbi:Co-chaperone Hsc20 [Clavulina sp. PMI_390]|nr:Co-chaperone Hsc20 [Clavulina sp. PMI_390]
MHALSRSIVLLPRTYTRPFSSSFLKNAALPHSPYHALFNLQQGSNPFVIDLSELRKNFLQAQRSAHPDAVVGQGSAAQTVAGVNSAELNKAYRTLQSPLQRAEYLLSLHGVKVGEEDKLDGEDQDHAEFIMEVMEARSELEDAESEDEIAQIRQDNRARMAETIGVLEEAFRDSDITRALKASIRLRYWESLEDAARERS